MMTEAEAKEHVTSTHVEAVKSVLIDSPILHVSTRELEAMFDSVWDRALNYFQARQSCSQKEQKP